jgi:hypothetical protein
MNQSANAWDSFAAEPQSDAGHDDVLPELIRTRDAVRDRLGEAVLACEKQRRAVEHVRTAWLQVFGKEYLAFRQSSIRLQQAELTLARIEAAPEQTREQIQAALQEALNALEQEGADAAHRSEMVDLLQPLPHTEGSVLSEEQLDALLMEAREALRFLHRLHPDGLPNQFPSLTQAQCAELDGLFQRFKVLRASDLRYEPGQVGFLLPDVSQLNRAARRGRAILAEAGIDGDPDAVVLGDTLEERIAWVRAQIEELEGEIERAEAERRALERDKELSGMRKQLHEIHKSPRKEKEIRRGLLARAERFGKQAAAVMRKTEAHFSRGAA